MSVYGTGYGGWWLPADHGLGPNSFIVSAGVGEDISFDLTVQSKFGCRVLLVDPTEHAARHVREMQEVARGEREFESLSGSIQPDYARCCSGLQPNWDAIEFAPVGLWSSAGELKFYKQENPLYVSQSLVAGMFGREYTTVPVQRLRDLLVGRPTPELVKLDIEGAEIAVLESMLEDSILPRILCVEFDLFLKGKDTAGDTKRIIRRLMEEGGYRLAHNANWNLTLVREN